MSFGFHRGSLALDFAGTVGSRASPAPEERLPDADALAAWLREAGLVDDAQPAPAELAAAHRLREAIYALGAARVVGRPADAKDVAVVNAAARGRRVGAARLGTDGAVSWVADAPVAFALGRIAEDAMLRLSVDGDRLV